MNFLDILLLAALAGILVLAARSAVKRAHTPGCSCCGGECANCSRPEEKKQRERRDRNAPEDLSPRGEG